MSTIPDISEPASELEHLIAELSESGLRAFVFGVGWLDRAPYRRDHAGVPRTSGPALVARRTRRRHGELDDGRAVDEITAVRFVRGPYPFPSFPGREVLVVEFVGPGGESVLGCYVHDLYDGERMRPEKLEAWRALRERYGNRDESRVDQGTLLAPGRLNHRGHRPTWARSSNASSNTDVPDRTDADRLEHVGADQPEHRTISDWL